MSKIPVLALLEPYEHHGRFQEDLDETVKLLGPFDLHSLRPHQSLCLSPSKSVSTLLACLSSPPSIHLFTCWHLGVGTPPGCQIARRAPRPRLASSFLLMTHSTPGNNAHSVPLSFPLISPGLRAKLEPLSLSPPPPPHTQIFLYLSSSPAFVSSCCQMAPSPPSAELSARLSIPFICLPFTFTLQ